MPAFYVTSPQGQKFKVNAPDGASQEDVLAYAQQNMPQEKGFLDRVGEDFSERQQDVSSKMVRDKTGNPTNASTFRALGNSLGFLAGDIPAEGIKSVASYAPEIIKKPIRQAAKYVGDSSVGQTVQQGVGLAGMGYDKFKEAQPYAAANIEAGLGFASAIPGGLVTKKAAEAIPAPGFKNTKNAIKGASARTADDLVAVTSSIETRSANAYKKMRDTGVGFTPETSQGIVGNVQDAVKDEILNPKLHAGFISVLKQFEKEAASKEMGLDRLDKWRRAFSSVASNGYKAGGSTDDARLAMKAISSIDDSVDRLSARNFTGVDINASPKLQSAIDEWGSLKDLERHLENTVEGTAQFAGKQGGFWRRQTITRAADDAKNLANVKKQIRTQENLISHLEDSVASSPKSAKNAKEAISSLREGRKEWARAKKFETVAEIVRKSAGDVDYLKRELRKLSDNPKKIRGFTEAERTSLLSASRYSNTEGILKMLGKFGVSPNMRLGQGTLPAIAVAAPTAFGSGPLGVAAVAGGTAAKYGQKLIGRGKAEDLLQQIQRQQ